MIHDLLTETLGRIVYVTCPIWSLFYFAWHRDWMALLVGLVWAAPLFVVGIPLHGFWFAVNGHSILRERCIVATSPSTGADSRLK